MTESFTYFYSPAQNFDKIQNLWEKFAETGVINCIVDCIKEYSQDISAAQLSMQGVIEDQMEFEMINTINSNSAAIQRKKFTDTTLSNFFKLLAQGSKCSLLVIGTIINGGTIESLEAMLPNTE